MKQGQVTKITKTATKPEDKSFQGAAVEGKKA